MYVTISQTKYMIHVHVLYLYKRAKAIGESDLGMKYIVHYM